MCSADALSQVCQDMYSTYVVMISAETAVILSQNVLQPQQLTESYLAGISGDCDAPSVTQSCKQQACSVLSALHLPRV